MSSINQIFGLTKRNTKLFYRDKSNLFFSVLGILILVALHFLVFRDMLSGNWEQILSNIPNVSVTKEHIYWIVDSLMFAAVIPIGAFTLSLTCLSTMVADKESNAISDFLVSPIKRNSLLTSYLFSSFIVGFVVSCGFIVFFEVYFMAVYSVGFDLIRILLILCVTVFALIFANVFMLLLISFFDTQQALGAVGTIVGTMLGFVNGAYIPIGIFGEVVANIFSCLPFLQITVLMKKAFLINLEKVIPLKSEILEGEISKSFGLDVYIGNNLFDVGGIVIISSATALVLLIALIIRFKYMKKV